MVRTCWSFINNFKRFRFPCGCRYGSPVGSLPEVWLCASLIRLGRRTIESATMTEEFPHFRDTCSIQMGIDWGRLTPAVQPVQLPR